MSDLALSIDSSDSDGSNETVLVFHKGIETLYKYINGWDVSVNIDVDATYREDKSFSDSEPLTTDDTVNAGNTSSDILSEPWEILQFTVKPNGNPSSGTFELRVMD